MSNKLTKIDYDSIEVYAMIGSGDKIASLLKEKGVTEKSEAETVLNNIKGSIARACLTLGSGSSSFDIADRLCNKILNNW
jgi:hypothetical protein